MRKLVTRLRQVNWLTSLSLFCVAGGLGLWFFKLREDANAVGRGNAAYVSRDWSSAADLARARLKKAPNDLDALRLLARATGRLGRDSIANALFAKLGSAGLEPEDFFLLGLGFNRSGKTAEAERLWERALAIDAHHPDALEQLALLYTARNRLAEAAVLADRLSQQPGWQLQGELLLGSLRSEMSDPTGAAKIVTQALARPGALSLATDIAARYRKLLARSLLQTSRPEEARALLGKQLELGPDEEAWWLLSRAELALGAVAAASDALKLSGSYRKLHPLESEPGPYVGEARCALCHGEIFEAQQANRHSSTLLWGPRLAEMPIPEQPIKDPDDPAVSHVFGRDAGRIRYETHMKDEVRKAIVEYAFGSLEHYTSLVGADDKGRPHILRLSHHESGRDSGWVRTTGHSADAGGGRDLLGKPLDPVDGIHKCLFCHSTNPTAVLSNSGLESSDRGIGCERCHGPGGLHLKAVAGKFRDRAIVNPKNATAEGRLRVCGQCHSYHQELSLPRTDSFWIRFQGTTLPWSRCYTESGGALDCTTCHDPHKSEVSTAEDYASRCLTCHSGGPKPSAAPSDSTAPALAKGRTVVCPINPRAGCVACHMPPFWSEPIHATFADHYIRVHPEVKAQSRK